MRYFSIGEEATDETNAYHFTVLVHQGCNNWVVQEGRTCASTKTCPERDCSATGLFSHVANVYWALNPVFCKEVVSLSCDRFSTTVSISNTLKLHKNV